MKMPIKKAFRQVYKQPKLRWRRLQRRSGFILFAISIALFCLTQVLCYADLTAISLQKGVIKLEWTGGQADIYRDTAVLKGLDDISGKLINTNAATGWEDENTTDGTKYYYAVDAGGTLYYDDAIADRTPPSVENVTALPSPFSPDGDRIEDTTRIFFTLTESTYVTLNIYFPDITAPDDESQFTLIKTLLRGSEVMSPGDHFRDWDGTDGTGAVVTNAGRYIYRFEVSDPADTDDELLEDKDPPVDTDGLELPRTRDEAGNILLQNISGDVWIHVISYEIRDISVTPTPFSPDGDKVRDVTSISYVVVDPDSPTELSTDYVTGNIRAIVDGQQEIIATVYAECLDYYWDYSTSKWVPFHVTDGIRPGLSSEKYYLRPVNSTLSPANGGDPPFHVSSPYPAGRETIQAYLNYRATLVPADADYTNYWNWEPVSFSLQWNGTGATSASTYIIGLEAVKWNGAKTLQKTHGIVIESPTIVPNDKTPPVVEFTIPMADSVYTAQLEYVQAYLNDGQGTQADLAKSSIVLLGLNGELVPGKQSNDGVSVITWRLHSALAEDGSMDGVYTIVVSAMDYAKNKSDDLQFQFEYNTSVNDDVPPGVVDLPLALDGSSDVIDSISDDGSTIIDESISALRVNICDSGSGMDLGASLIELVKVVGSLEVLVSGEKNSIPETPNCGHLLLQLSSGLLENGEDDGLYRLKVTSADLAGNTAEEEFSFTYKTVDDTDAPYVISMKLLDESDGIIAETPPPAPFHLGQVSEPVAAVCASVFDDTLSAGLSFEEDKSYIILEGPGIITGEIQYTERGRTGAGDAFANIVFVMPVGEPLSEDGEYTATVIVEDISGNQSVEVIGTFEYVSDSNVIEDVDPPLINGVVVISPTEQNKGPICLDRCPYVKNPTGIRVPLFDQGADIDTELSLIRLIEPDVWWLFDINSGIQGDLNAGNIPTALRDEFDDSENPLSADDDKIIVLIEEENRRWLINDVGAGRMYTVKKVFTETGGTLTDELRVYARYTVNGELTTARTGVGSVNIYLNWPVALSIKGWYTLDVFAVDNAQRELFSIDLDDFQGEHGSDLAAELDYCLVSDELRDGLYGFADNGITLSENVIVSVRDRGCLWLITDLGQSELGVYSAGGCRWREINDQRTYIVERKVWKEGGDVKSRLDISESNSTTVQIPDVLFFDDTPPEIDSIEIYSQDTLLPSSGITQFDNVRAAIQEDDSGIDYDATGIVLTDENGIVIPGSLEIDEEAGTVRWLLKDGQDLSSGTYDVEVRTRDMAGNAATSSIDFRAVLEAQEPKAPAVVSVTPADGSIINGIITQVSAILKDNSGTGIDFEESYIELNAPSGAPSFWETDGYESHNEASNIIIWNLNQSLATDGRGDGEYEISVRAYDNEGRRSDRIRTTFIYDSQPPTVQELYIGSKPWISMNYMPISSLEAGGTNQPLSKVVVKLEDEFSAIDLINSRIELQDIAAEQTNDGIDTLILDFPQFSDDGEDDGAYQISISAMDELGNSNAFPYTYTFIYDSQPPQVACAQAFMGDESVVEVLSLSTENNTPAPIFGSCLLCEPDQVSLVLGKLDRIKVKLDDGSLGVGIDLIASLGNLFVHGPHGQIAGNRDTEGDDVVVFIFDTPLSANDSTDDGLYTVKTNAVDLVGNQTPVEFSFEYRAMAPVVQDVEVTTDDDEIFSLTNDESKQFERSVTEIRVIVEDRSGKGINFDQTIVSVDGPGACDDDAVENDGVNTVIYTFDEPLANNGTDDGQYFVFVRAVDNDGHWEEYLWWFIYDTTSPEVVSTTPADGEIISEPISGVSATLSDALTDLDLFASVISLSGPVSIAATQVNNGVDTIELSFFPLADNGSADGLYEISVDPRDILDNRPPEPFKFDFIYDTTPPILVSSEPSTGEIVTVPPERISVVLSDGDSDSTAGVNMATCSLELIGPDGAAVPGSVLMSGADSLAFIPGKAMAADGTDDGTYTIGLITQDQADNVSDPILVSFTYTTRSPSLLWTSPVNGAGIRIPVGSVSAVLKDNSGAGLDLQTSSITLIGPDGEPVPGTPSSVEPDTILFTMDNLLATDGSDDGIYTLDILAADNTGISVNYTTTFVYDRTPPIVDVTLPADGDVLNDALDSVWAQLEDAHSGIDLNGSKIWLTDASGSVTGTQVNDGIDTIKYRFAPQSIADGQYTINVTPQDIVGNTPPEPQTFSFIYDTTAPVIKRTEPAQDAAVIVALNMVTVRLDDGAGAGVDLSESQIKLIDPDGREIIGVQTNNSIDALILTFPSLSVNGIDDGEYTIIVKAQDLAGNSNTESIVFEYKTLAPALVDVEVRTDDDEVFSLTKDEYKQFERSVTEIRVILEDKSDQGLNFDQTTVMIDGPGASANDVIGNDGVDTIIYVFAKPFANNGTDDGRYDLFIRAVDNDGHFMEYSGWFIFDTTSPAVVSTIPADGSVISEPISQVSATLSDEFTRLDLFESDISLSGPASISATQVNDGVDTLELVFFPLADDGSEDGR